MLLVYISLVSFAIGLSSAAILGNGTNIALFILPENQQNVSLCRMPNTLPGWTVDPTKTVGTWYTWMFNSPGPLNYNMMFTYVPLNMNNGQLSLAWYSSFWTQPNGNRTCNAMFAQHNLATNGVKTGYSVMSSPGQNPTPESTTYTTIFTDYNTVEIIYRCIQPNPGTGICDVPLILVNTRQQPNYLPQAAQLGIANVVIASLNNYCNSNSLRKVVWDNTMLACNPAVPATITRLI